jgi:hypothetical protein
MDVACDVCQGDEECVGNLKGDRHRCVDNIMNRIDVVGKVSRYYIEDG